MAVTINGSGTIAGVSTGGINDNVVDNGTMADDAIDSAEIADGAVDLVHLSATGTASSSTFLRGDNSWAAAGGGKLLNIVQQVYDEANSSGSIAADTEWYTAMTVSIQPSAATSKVLIEGTLHMCASAGACAIGLRLKSDAGGSEAIITGTAPDQPGSRVAAYAGEGDNWDDSIKNINFKFLHSPNTTSTVQYKVYAVHDKNENMVMHINRSATDNNSTADSRYCSFMFATEIGA